MWLTAVGATNLSAVVLWSDPDAALVCNNGAGADLLGGAVKRDDLANDTLYFKFHVDPLSDETTEPYFAALELFEGNIEKLGVGNALDAWAYSAFFNSEGMLETNRDIKYFDLHSARPNSTTHDNPVNFQLPHRGTGATIVFKIQYVVGSDDLVTVWLDPDLGPGATEIMQPEVLTTRFNADASFDEIRLRHAGLGDGWTFSDLSIATSFSDFVDVSAAKPGGDEVDFAHGAQSLHFRSWTKEQGLPTIPVRTLTQTRDGYLWFGSDAGVTRFDGLRFVPFDEQQGIASRSVRTLFGDSHGALWIGNTSGGLQYWLAGQGVTLTTNTGLPSDSITALSEDNQGRVWIGTEAGLILWEDGRLMPLKNAATIETRPITALYKDQQGNMWLGVKGLGLFQYAEDKLVRVADVSEDALLEDSRCLLMDSTGRLWVGVAAGFVLCRENNHWSRYPMPRHAAGTFVNALAEEADGTLWAGSAGGGLLEFKKGKFTTVSANSGLSGNSVDALLVDREGDLWVGTDEGLNRLQRKSLFALGQNEGLGFGAVQGLAEVSPGITWAVKSNDGIYRWDGRSFRRLNAAGLSQHDSQINALLMTSDGACWVAVTNGLLRYKDPRAAADEATLFTLPGTSILALAEDHHGFVWAGTKEGKIWRLSEGRWQEQLALSTKTPITALLPMADEAVWIGTDGAGLFHFKGEASQPPAKIDGLASDSIRTLHLDTDGTLWIGTAGGGLSRWHENRIFNFTTREGFPDNSVSQILKDNAGRLWLGTSHGIACLSKRQFEAMASAELSTLSPQIFNRANGLPSEECTGGFCPAGMKTESGLLWFSTTKGVAVVVPQNKPAEKSMLPVALEEILIDGVPAVRTTDPGTLRVPPGRHRMELRFTGLRFNAPEAIRFRYKLEGLDSSWIDAGASRIAVYNFVPPGEYYFYVIACNSDGFWSTDRAELKLVFARYFWQSWWFIGLAVGGILGGVGGTVRLVEKQKAKRKLNRLEQERALEQERTRIAQDLHDEMGAKLCRISFLSEHARRGDITPTDLKEQITSISDESRDVLHSLDEIVWAVNPQNDTLEHLASYLGQYAHDYFQMTGLECELDIPRNLPPNPVSSYVRHHLFLAVREALTNILKHSSATKVGISLAWDDSRFEIRITDNGKGYAMASGQPRRGTTAGEADSGNGLPNMNRRLTDLGGHCEVESHPGTGTTVKFILPLKTTP